MELFETLVYAALSGGIVGRILEYLPWLAPRFHALTPDQKWKINAGLLLALTVLVYGDANIGNYLGIVTPGWQGLGEMVLVLLSAFFGGQAVHGADSKRRKLQDA